MEISQHWRLKKERYNLVGSECPHCGHKSFPPRAVCPNCAAEAHRAAAMPVEVNAPVRAESRIAA